MKNVLLIDVGYLEYFKCFSASLSKYCNVTIITKSGIDLINLPAKQKKWFYLISQKMKPSKIRSLLRGMEYIWGYCIVCVYALFHHFDIIHIHWAVIPKIDCFFFAILKKLCKKLIFTAHDFVPHSGIEIQKTTLEKLYDIPDKIIVHGENCIGEAKQYFPSTINKLYVQNFGPDSPDKIKPISNECLEKHEKLINMNVEKKLNISFIGQISNYKGVDLFLDYIINNPVSSKCNYFIVGKIVEDYTGLKEKLLEINDREDVYEYIHYFDDEEENLFYSISDLIVIPYRSATMSGVFFTAAKYKKALLTTTEGCLKEYIDKIPKYSVNGEQIGVFTCAPDLSSLTDSLDYILKHFSKKDLQEIGGNYSKHIYDTYSWDSIIKGVIRDCYDK